MPSTSPCCTQPNTSRQDRLNWKNNMIDLPEMLKAHILVVDDQEANVMLLEQMLRNAGYINVDVTQDPRTVAPLHRKNNYDLILLDLQMPEMDGFEVMEALKDIEQGSYLPVLVITAQPGHKLRALKAGAKDFVGKPFDLVEVQTRIQNMLEVRLLYRRLAGYNAQLEATVIERTAELRASEARFQRFTELSSDWYWEQDAQGALTRFSGPVAEVLGIGAGGDPTSGGWNPVDRALLEENIRERRPFLNFVYRRRNPDNSIQYLQVSGEPMFDSASRFAGYRGIGMDITDVIDGVIQGIGA
jgi:CheY-like chemotaxis protein